MILKYKMTCKHYYISPGKAIMLFLFFIIIFSNQDLRSQSITFQKEYPYNGLAFGEVITQTLDGGYIIGGTVIHEGYYFVRTNEYGDSIWGKVFEGPAPAKIIQ